jgi:hypothetical protein
MLTGAGDHIFDLIAMDKSLNKTEIERIVKRVVRRNGCLG